MICDSVDVYLPNGRPRCQKALCRSCFPRFNEVWTTAARAKKWFCPACRGLFWESLEDEKARKEKELFSLSSPLRRNMHPNSASKLVVPVQELEWSEGDGDSEVVLSPKLTQTTKKAGSAGVAAVKLASAVTPVSPRSSWLGRMSPVTSPKSPKPPQPPQRPPVLEHDTFAFESGSESDTIEVLPVLKSSTYQHPVVRVSATIPKRKGKSTTKVTSSHKKVATVDSESSEGDEDADDEDFSSPVSGSDSSSSEHSDDSWESSSESSDGASFESGSVESDEIAINIERKRKPPGKGAVQGRTVVPSPMKMPASRGTDALPASTWTPTQVIKPAPATFHRHSSRREDEFNDYFITHGSSKGAGAGRGKGKGKGKGKSKADNAPVLETEEHADLSAFLETSLLAGTKAPPLKHAAQKKARLTHLQQVDFPAWRHYFVHYNCMLYGMGSKRELLLSLAQSLHCPYTLVINGYLPGTSFKQVLRQIFVSICGLHFSALAPLTSQMEILKEALEWRVAQNLLPGPILLCIHAVEGLLSRHPIAMKQLLGLASLFPHIRLIASVDHLNAPLLFSQAQAAELRAMWFDASTLQSYSVEAAFTVPVIGATEAAAVKAAAYVLRSLTPNALKAFLELAHWQRDHGKGMPLAQLFEACRENFIFTHEGALRAQLVEFKDHGITNVVRNKDGVDIVTVGLDKASLQQLLERLESGDDH
jgi:origin recognition complex subunit 2